MRLLHPNAGELVDRQTILQLKIHYGSGGQEANVDVEEKETETATYTRKVIKDVPAINVQPFIDENNQIQDYLAKNWIRDLHPRFEDSYNKFWDELFEVNEQLWKLTDQAHTLAEAPDKMADTANKRAAEVLYEMVRLNDKRAELIRKINELWGVRVQEKIFA